MKRAVVFAHYDKNNLVDDYVVYYLNALKQIASEIVFVSCCKSLNTEKLNVSHVIVEEHDEYDFGSYKRGLLYLQPRLDEFDEIVFVNDSCYGPFFPLVEMFEEMGTKDCDFWGVTENQVGLIPSKNDKYKTINCKHLQSYFLVFKKNVFTSKVFLDFIKSVKHFENKNDVIINCEIGLSKILYSNGFVSDCYIKKYRNFDNVTIYFWRQLIKKYKMPFVKCSILRHQNDDRTYSDGWQNLIASCSNYPISIIEKNLETYITNPKNSSCIKMLCLNVVAFLPSFFKKVFRKIMKNNF